MVIGLSIMPDHDGHTRCAQSRSAWHVPLGLKFSLSIMESSQDIRVRLGYQSGRTRATVTVTGSLSSSNREDALLHSAISEPYSSR
jgi:hypothetical protein